MLQPDTPFINLEPCTPREFSDSDDELSESGQSFEMELTEFPGYSEVSSSQNTPQPSVKRFRSFSASKLAIPVKFSAEAQIRELEAKLVEKENEVLLAADIGQVLLKEIDSLKHKVAAYEHSKPADDLSQEIEINNTETVQKLRSFRVEAEIYTSSFKEKTPKIPGSPYTPGRRMDRSGTPGLLPINENDPDLTVLPPSALLPSKNSTSTLHSEISKAVESGENLMKLSRQLQTKLLDAERESLNLAERCSEQDRQIAALKIQVARGAENEAKSQENTWNLELQNQELQTQVDELEQVVQKVTSDQGRLQESLLVARETIDQLNLKEEKLNQTLERTKTRHEQEIIGIRKMIGNLQREKAELSKKNEELKLELSGRTQRAGGRPLGGSTPILEPAASGIDSPFELSDAFELPPARSPSPSPFSAPSSGQTLQVETLTGSLGHAHRTIANLRSSLHREKIEKMEMKKMLVESQETVEALQSEFMWESEDMDKVMKNVHRSVRKKMRRRKTHMRQVVTKSELFGDDVEVVVGSPEDILKDRADLSEGSSPSTEEDLSEFSMDSGAEKVSDNEHRQSSDSPRTPVPNRSTTPTGSPPGTMKKWTPSRNPLARRSTLNPMPSRDLLNELTMFDRQPKIEEGSEKVDISTQTTEATDGHESHDQGVQVELLDLETTRGLCTECGSTVDIIYLLSSKVAEASAVLSTPEDQEDNLSTPESFKPDSAAPSMVSETQASTIPQSIVDQPLFENEELDREIESSKVASSEPQANESRAGTCTLEMNSDVLEVPVAAELEENRQTINTDSLEVQQNEDASANISSAPQTTGEKDLTEHSKGQSPNVSNLPGPSQSTLPFLDAMANVEAESDAEAKRIPTRPLMWTDSPKVRKSIESDRQAFYPSETDLESSQSAEVEDKEVETTPTKERHVAARISAVKPRTSVEKPTLSSPLSRENSLNQSMVDSELDDSDIPDHALHRISPRISAVKSRPSQDIIRAAMDKYGSPLKSSGTGTDIESEEDPVAIQFSEVATQVSGNSDSEAPLQCDVGTQTDDISKLHVLPESNGGVFYSPLRPTTPPPPGLIARSLSPVRVDRSSLRIADEVDLGKNPEVYHQAANHRRPPIPVAMLFGGTPTPRGASQSRTLSHRRHSDGESEAVISESSTKRYQTVTSYPGRRTKETAPSFGSPTVWPSRPFSAITPRGMDTFSSSITDSSFTADEESWGDQRRTFSADPAIIHAITQAMIGNFMWKYTRRVIGGGISEKKHMRYFWIHPYAKTINWSTEQPGPDRVVNRVGSKSKSAYIRSIRVVQDTGSTTDLTSTEFSLVIQTATRELKIKALKREKHDIWLLALTYLQSRQTMSPSITQKSLQSPQLGEADPEKTPQRRTLLSVASTVQSNLSPLTRSVSKKHSLGRLFKKPSKSTLASPIPDVRKLEEEEDGQDLEMNEDVRKCCHGKHDIGKLDAKSTLGSHII